MLTLFFREGRLTVLAILVLLSAGASTFLTVGRQEDPTITNLFATIVTPYPGADPARVEALVTDEIEDQLREIAEIDTIDSESRSGVSVVIVELSSFISDAAIEQAWSEIRDALAEAALSFPAGVQEPDFDNDRTGAFTAISALVPRLPGVPPAIIARAAETLEDRLRNVSGTKLVRTFGEPSEEILVSVDADRLAALGLTVEQVSAVVRQADAKISAGRLLGEESDLLIEVAGEIDSLDRIRAIPLIASPQGFMTRVGDVATITKAARSPPSSIAYSDGAPAVLVAAQMDDDLQVDRWMARVHLALAEFEAALPGGLEHRLIFDQSGYTRDRFIDVGVNMALGVALVIAVLLLTLGVRGALVVATILPLVSLASVATLSFLGVPIHQMSMTGLIVALGLLVDAAIVMTDEIRQRLAQGQPREQAVGGAVRRLGAPLLASTVTTALAFMPMALLPGPAGDFVGSIAIAVIVMLIWSLVIAMTLTPALAGWLLPDPGEGRGGILADGIGSGALGRAFEASIRVALHRPRLAVLYALVLPLVGFASFPTLTAQFFPGVDRDQLYIDVEMPTGTSIHGTERTALAIGALLRADERIRSVAWVIGESAPSFYYNMQMNRDRAPDFARALVTTVSEEATAEVIAPLQARLDGAFPNARVLVRGLIQGPPVNAPVELRFVGPDLAVLRSLGDDARRIVQGVAGITHVRTTAGGGPPQLEFRLDEEKVRMAGLDLVSVAGQLDTTLEGAVGGSLIEGAEELPVRVRVGDVERRDTGFVSTLDLLSAQSVAAAGPYAGVPLSALGEMRVVPSDSPISAAMANGSMPFRPSSTMACCPRKR